MVRVLLLTLLLIGCLLGCNSDPRCRRETALLRSEILDLEDKYYMVKAQRDDALAALEGEGKHEPASKIRKRFINESIPQNQEIYYGESAYSPSSDECFIDEYSANSVPDNQWLNEEASPAVNSRETSPRSPANSLRAPAENTRSGNPTPNRRETGNPSTKPAAPGQSLEEIPSKSLIDPPTSTDSGSSQNGRSTSNKTRGETVSSSNLVTEIVIDKDQTFTKSKDGEPTGIVLCLLPRDANGRSREVSGELTVSIVDPSLTSSAQRLGLWKFMPIELELFYESENERKKMILDLPFEDALPTGKEVVVMVRFQTEDGRVLETTSRIKTNSAAKSKASPPIKIDHGDSDLRAEKPQWRPVR